MEAIKEFFLSIDQGYYQLALAAVIPVVLATFLYCLEKKTPFGKSNYWLRQIIYGIIFGLIAVYGTEKGVPINGAQMNCRDAAVLTGGLMFGAPAGIIAGIIGGVERWFAVYWGIGTFTRVACSVSTMFAGFYSAFLRKYMFENKKPGWALSLAIGVVMEVLHLTMVFVTNMGTPEKAIEVVKSCTFPMVISNGISVMLAAIFISIFSNEKTGFRRDKRRISQIIQKWLLFAVLCAFFSTSYFVFSLQTEIANRQADDSLNSSIDQISSDIKDTTTKNILEKAHIIASEGNKKNIDQLALDHSLTEINIVDENGIISASTNPEFVGFDMNTSEQSKEFLPLLGNVTEIVQDYGPISFDANIWRKYAGVKTRTGFIQIGYDSTSFKANIGSLIASLTKNRKVGQNGFICIISEDCAVVGFPSSMSLSSIEEASPLILSNAPRERFALNIGEEEFLCRYDTVEGYYVVSMLPSSEALQMRNVAMYVNSFMEIIVFAILFALIYFLIKKVVVNQIKEINGSLSRITEGDLNTVVNVRSNEEFASLSDDINSTVDTLKKYIAEASARIDKELEFAKSIQASALPNVFPAFPKRKDFDIFASMNPAKEVGGDFYDFYLTHENFLHFLVADVSGKGIPAAMFMMRAKTELKSLTEADMPIADVFTHGNHALCEGNDAGMFVTAWQGGIDLANGKLRFANAGHNPPLIYKRSTEKFEYLRTRAGFVLAGMDEVRYKPQEIQLDIGDIIFLYTDGVTEAQNALGELYGEGRLLEAINSKEFENVQALCKYVKADVDRFAGDAPQFDDITMLAFKYLGTPPSPTIHFENADFSDIPKVTEFIEKELIKMNCPSKAIKQICVSIDEIYSNIVKYGYTKGKKGPITVKLITREEPRRVFVRFEDEGIPYNPLTKEDPDVSQSLEDRISGGLGIFIVKKSMDGMKYKYENDKNILSLIKYI